MRHIFVVLLFCLGFAVPALADGVAFPPDDCSAATPFMAFNGVATGGNTYCRSGQDVIRNAIPTCQANQIVAYNGTSFYCKNGGGVTQQTVMTCVSPPADDEIVTCTTAACPADYVRSGCSVADINYNDYVNPHGNAWPVGTSQCACSGVGIFPTTCYTYCVK